VLVLTRKTNESIVIGDQIVVTVVEVRGDQVKVGISAPPQIAVHRREVWEEIRKGNLKSTARRADLDRAAAAFGQPAAPSAPNATGRAEPCVPAGK
jgi:carbon storage regulator